MKQTFKPTNLYFRLLLIATLVSVLSAFFATQPSLKTSFFDKTQVFLETATQELSADSNNPLNLDDNPDFLSYSYRLFTATRLSARSAIIDESNPRLNLLFQIRPRSPPQTLSA